MITVTFMPFNQKLEVQPRANLMAAIIQAKLPIGSSCGGVGVCTKCLVKVLDGIENLSKPNAIERKLVLRENVPTDMRVSCQTKILGPVTITATYW